MGGPVAETSDPTHAQNRKKTRFSNGKCINFLCILSKLKNAKKTYLQPMCERREEGRERNGREVRGPSGSIQAASEERHLQERTGGISTRADSALVWTLHSRHATNTRPCPRTARAISSCARGAFRRFAPHAGLQHGGRARRPVPRLAPPQESGAYLGASCTCSFGRR